MNAKLTTRNIRSRSLHRCPSMRHPHMFTRFDVTRCAATGTAGVVVVWSGRAYILIDTQA